MGWPSGRLFLFSGTATIGRSVRFSTQQRLYDWVRPQADEAIINLGDSFSAMADLGCVLELG